MALKSQLLHHFSARFYEKLKKSENNLLLRLL